MVVFVAAAVGVLVSLASTFQLDLFTPSRWHGGGSLDVWVEILIAAVPSLLLALAGSALVASHYRRQHKRNTSA